MPPTLVSRMRAAEELLYEQEMWEEDESGEYPRSEEGKILARRRAPLQQASTVEMARLTAFAVEMRVLRKLAGCQPTAPVPISNRFFSSEIRQSTAKRLHGNPWSTNTMKFALTLLDDAEIPKNVCIALATSNVHLKPEKLSTPSFKDWDPKVHDTIVVTHYLQGYPLGSRLTTVDDSEASMRESEGGGIWYLVICKIKEVEDGVLVVDVDSIESGQKVSATRTDANDAYNKTMNALVAGIGKHAKKLMKGVNEIQHGFKKVKS